MNEKKHRYNKDFRKPAVKEATETVTEEKEVVKKIQKKVNTKSKLNVRRTPEVANNIIGELDNGTIVTVVSEKDGWTEIAARRGLGKGYVMTKFLEDNK